jgi:hypothetical protein
MSRQLELFRGGGRREMLTRIGRASSQREQKGDEAPSTPVADSCTRDDRSQDRHRNPSIGQGPVRGQTVLAQALGKAPEPFDFDAAIAVDPRAVPQPDVPVPEWLRLPGVDDQT